MLQIPESDAEAKAGMKKVIRVFLSALHPDKNMGSGSGEQHDRKIAAMTQVTAYLNEIYCFFKAD